MNIRYMQVQGAMPQSKLHQRPKARHRYRNCPLDHADEFTLYNFHAFSPIAYFIFWCCLHCFQCFHCFHRSNWLANHDSAVFLSGILLLYLPTLLFSFDAKSDFNIITLAASASESSRSEQLCLIIKILSSSSSILQHCLSSSGSSVAIVQRRCLLFVINHPSASTVEKRLRSRNDNWIYKYAQMWQS